MKHALSIFMIFSVFFLVDDAFSQLNQGKPAILDEVGIDEQLGDQIPLDLVFTNSNGEDVTLKELMADSKPVLLNPLYYDCPTLCGLVLDAVFNVVDDLAWSPGKEYTIISFSIDPEETPEMASMYKEKYLNDLNRTGAEDGWHFLTGDVESIEKLSESIGFRYSIDERTGEYMHLAGIMMLSPNGIITRYLYGIKFNEFDLRNALYESADGKIGSTIDRAILYCFTYDPSSQSYVPVAMNIMKLGGLATALILGIFLTILWRREKGSSQPEKIDFE